LFEQFSGYPEQTITQIVSIFYITEVSEYVSISYSDSLEITCFKYYSPKLNTITKALSLQGENFHL